jgi:hypothetical protein
VVIVRSSAGGPLCEFASVRKCGALPVMCRMQGMGPAGAGLRMRRPAARGALRYSPWGRAAELSSLALLVALEQLRRVSLRSARLRAPTPGLRSSPSHTQPGTGRPQALRERIVLGESVWQAAGIEPAACRAPQARHRARAGLDARLLPFHSNKEPSVPSPFSYKEQVPPRQAVGGCAVARLCGGEEHRVSVGARTRALRQLTHRICSSATNTVSEASYAVRPKPEHRSEVGAPLAPTAAVARHRAPARSLAPASTSNCGHSTSANGPPA